jgi:hypothetical protein
MSQLIVHGGAGKARNGLPYREGLEESLRRGYSALEKEGALEAVIAAVLSLENNPLFNCGTGSALNLDGEAEMDASVMTSEERFGAVGSVKRVEHPILLARRVMEETDHLLIAGDTRSTSLPWRAAGSSWSKSNAWAALSSPTCRASLRKRRKGRSVQWLATGWGALPSPPPQEGTLASFPAASGIQPSWALVPMPHAGEGRPLRAMARKSGGNSSAFKRWKGCGFTLLDRSSLVWSGRLRRKGVAAV